MPENNVLNKKIIFIVEDNQVYARSLQSFIHSRFSDEIEIRLFCIGETSMLDMHHNPDIVIMDYFLNSVYEKADNGLRIIDQIKIIKPHIPSIILSVQQNADVISETVKRNDCYYVQKNEEAFNKVEVLINKIFNLQNLRLAGLSTEPTDVSDN